MPAKKTDAHREVLLSIGIDLDKRQEADFWRKFRKNMAKQGKAMEGTMDFTSGLKKTVEFFNQQIKKSRSMQEAAYKAIEEKQKLLQKGQDLYFQTEVGKINGIREARRKANDDELKEKIKVFKEAGHSEDQINQRTLHLKQKYAEEDLSFDKQIKDLKYETMEKAEEDKRKLEAESAFIEEKYVENLDLAITEGVEHLDKTQGKVIQNIEDLTGKTEKYKDVLTKAGLEAKGLIPEDYIDKVRAMSMLAENLKKAQEEAGKGVELSEKKVKEIYEDLVKTVKAMNAPIETALKKTEKSFERAQENLAKSAQEIKEELLMSIPGVAKIPGLAGYSKRKEHAKDRTETFRTLQKKEGGAESPLTKFLGKILPLVNAFESFAPALTLVSAGLMGLVKMFIDAQAMAKEFNKSLMQGVGAADLGIKTNESVSDSLTKVRDTYLGVGAAGYKAVEANLAWMMSGKEQVKVFNELISTGVEESTVLKNVGGDARQASDMILTYSKDLGASTQDVAKFSSELMQNFLEGVDQVHKGFSELTEAQKESGIAGSRFFAAIQSITGQVDTMDSSLDYTAKALAKIGSSSIIGVDKTVKALGTLESKMTEKQAMMAFGMLTPAQRKDQIEAFKKRIKLRYEEIKADKTLTEDQKAAAKGRYDYQMAQAEAAEKGDQSKGQFIGFATGGAADAQLNETMKLATVAKLAQQGDAKGRNIMKLNAKELNSFMADNGHLLDKLLQANDLTRDVLTVHLGAMEKGKGNKTLEDILSEPAEDSKEAKSMEEKQFDKAQEIARNTTDISEAINIGMEYFLNQIYKILLDIYDIMPFKSAAAKAQVEIEKKMAQNNAQINELKQIEKSGTKDEKNKAKEQIAALDKQNKVLMNTTDSIDAMSDLDKKNPDKVSDLLASALEKNQKDANDEQKKNMEELNKKYGLSGSKVYKGFFKEAKDRDKYYKESSEIQAKHKTQLEQSAALNKTIVGVAQKADILKGDAADPDRIRYLREHQDEASNLYNLRKIEKNKLAMFNEASSSAAQDVFGISRTGYLPFPVSEGDILVQKDSLVDAMKGSPGAALGGIASGGGGGAPNVTININGGDIDRVRKVVFNVLHQFEAQKTA